MLELALKSGVPIIKVHTTDTVNARLIIGYLADKEVDELDDFTVDDLRRSKFSVLVANPSAELTGTYEDVYGTLVEERKTLVFVNTEYDSSLFLDCGTVPIPEPILRDTIEDMVPKSDLDAIIKTLGGLDLKTVGEAIRLTKTRDGNVTVKGLINTRSLISPAIAGLTQINTEMPFYDPMPEIEAFLELNLPYINSVDVDPRLRPRGLMFSGQSGTGKTQGAKYIAERLGLPLYLIDLAGLMTRWHGESETNLRHLLQMVDRESPCVVLMDEIEKVFSTSEEGTTNRLLGLLLWWMQERTSQVIVVMTCNRIETLPVELYREGRVDKEIVFTGISDQKVAEAFVIQLLKTYTLKKKITLGLVRKTLAPLFQPDNEGGINPVSQSKLAQITKDLIKVTNHGAKK
ncbi:ATP-dependent zinc metalloprotease [Vibrio phage LV6]|nr:ATP-dependent zinc metalloprotease [Vibrio phage LV6]